jgi:hypothetical protein
LEGASPMEDYLARTTTMYRIIAAQKHKDL